MSIWLDSYLAQTHNVQQTIYSKGQDGKAKAAIHGLQTQSSPASTQHLQEVINSTLLSEYELVWKEGGKEMTDKTRKAINRMARATL